MANSSNHLMGKAIRMAGKITLAGIICASVFSGGSAFAGNTTYQYDALGRVIKVTYPDSKQICYAYDSAGNRTQVKRQATGTCTVAGSTLTSSLTAQTMFAAQQGTELQATGEAVTTTEDQAVDATTTSDDTAPTN